MHLTKREMEVVVLVCQDRSSKEIAKVLQVNPKTINFHRLRISKKLGANNPIAFYRKCLEHGIVEPPELLPEKLNPGVTPLIRFSINLQ